MKSGLVGLQVIEIAQYRQTILWNGLQKKTLNLRKVAKNLQKGLEERGQALVNDRPRTLEQLRQLRAIGVRVAIDDFGTGYSCLSYPEIYPNDTLKIDRQFVSKLCRRSEAGATIRAIIDLAASFGIETVAEGVETREQLHVLLELGCRKARGYLLGRPERLVDPIKSADAA